MSNENMNELVAKIKADLEKLEEQLLADGHDDTAGIVRDNVITNMFMVELMVNQAYK